MCSERKKDRERKKFRWGEKRIKMGVCIKMELSTLMNGGQRVKERQRNLGREGKKNKKDVTLCTDEWQAESETEVEKLQAERGRKKIKI